ncbi:MAG: non-heme iron oxygenase ferredoxin subunit [Gammaproteobacteria bacterium]|nr:non-heme iron oxygenase ferredoxin subunit [Gammaproteobacteria bacterium]NNJ51342.1 non-heme iron oxygenase ferredoxin subunit [Gammaproteobacteria bacterium]
MLQFVHLASLEDLQTRKLLCVKTGSYRILIALAEGTVYAVDDMCTHEDASLSKGSLHADCVKCPLHGSRFRLSSGEALDEPAEEALNTYPVNIEGDDIMVGLPD